RSSTPTQAYGFLAHSRAKTARERGPFACARLSLGYHFSAPPALGRLEGEFITACVNSLAESSLTSVSCRKRLLPPFSAVCKGWGARGADSSASRNECERL